MLLSGVKPKTITKTITNSDALPLRHRILVGAKAIKLGSWDKHPAYGYNAERNWIRVEGVVRQVGSSDVHVLFALAS